MRVELLVERKVAGWAGLKVEMLVVMKAGLKDDSWADLKGVYLAVMKVDEKVVQTEMKMVAK